MNKAQFDDCVLREMSAELVNVFELCANRESNPKEALMLLGEINGMILLREAVEKEMAK